MECYTRVIIKENKALAILDLEDRVQSNSIKANTEQDDKEVNKTNSSSTSSIRTSRMKERARESILRPRRGGTESSLDWRI